MNGGEQKKSAQGPSPSTPIPLWPQYKMSRVGQELDEMTWTCISNSEPWVRHLVYCMTSPECLGQVEPEA